MMKFIGPVLDRFQYSFLQETLDASIAPDHPVRVFDFILDQHDWSDWYAQYRGGGRPPYPPEVMCKLLTYGYNVGIRSSRTLEHACHNNRDLIWLMSGRTPDHDTISEFRRKNVKKFKSIFRTTVAACVEAGMVSLKHLTVDGTRVAANNGRHQTKTAEQIEAMLENLDARIAKILAEAEAVDQQEDALFGSGCSPQDLPAKLKDIRQRQARLQQALEKVRAKAKKVKKDKGKDQDNDKRVPITDPDSDVMKNKNGGFGPNYTPYAGVDVKGGVIASEGVTNEHHDAGHLSPAIEEAQSTIGEIVEQVQADSNYATPNNLCYCEDNGIDPCLAPYGTSLERPSSCPSPQAWPKDVPRCADHTDGSVVDGPSIPRNKEGQIDKSAFSYDATSDVYICPTGQKLTPRGTYRRDLRGGTTTYIVYRCSTCRACPFFPVCTRDRYGRVVKRGEHEEVYARHAQRMEDSQRQKDYKLRRQTVEPVFGVLKEVLRVRQFLLRGLDGVRAEWTLACSAFNLKKLCAALGTARIFELRGAIPE